MFTPIKRRGGDAGMPDLSNPLKIRRESNQITQEVIRDVVNAGRKVGQLMKKIRKGSRNRSTKKRKMTPAPKVAMSNGSGQSMKMGKRVSKPKVTKPLKQRVASLEKKVRQNYGTHIFKQEATFQVTSIVNRCGYGEGTIFNATGIETLLDSVPYQSTATPGTPATWDATAATQPTKWNIKCFVKTLMRNNYLYPVNVRCYILKPKVDQSNTVQSGITSGISEQASSTMYSNTAPFLYPNDSKEWRDTWHVLNSCEMKLQSGDECEVPYNETIVYDQEFKDNNTTTYLRKYSRIILIRVVGVVCHDSVTTSQIGICPTALDCVIYRRMELKYPSAAPLVTNEVISGLSTVGTAVVGVASAETETAL